MSKRLAVASVVAMSMVLVSACGDKTTNRTISSQPQVAPVPTQNAVPASPAEAEPYNELLDPEFGCSGGGHLEYGLVDMD